MQYAIAMYAREEFMPCIENWEKSEKFDDSQNFKLLLKKWVFSITSSCVLENVLKKVIFFTIQRACTKRSGFFGCIDKYVSEVSGCYYPSELEIIRKMDKIVKNLVGLICSNDGNDFALLDVDGEAQQCLQSSQVEVMTCANKAVHSVAQRILEKWIEYEHFKFETESEDCKWVTSWTNTFSRFWWVCFFHLFSEHLI